MKSSHLLFVQFPFWITLLVTKGLEPNQVTLSSSDFTCFSTVVLSLSQDPFRMRHAYFFLVFLVSFKRWQFLPPCLLQPCDFWRVLLGYFCLTFFWGLDWDSTLWERISQRWSFFSIQCVGVHSVDMSITGDFILTVEDGSCQISLLDITML